MFTAAAAMRTGESGNMQNKITRTFYFQKRRICYAKNTKMDLGYGDVFGSGCNDGW